MEFHRIRIELLARDGNSPERLLERFEKTFQVREPQRLTKKFKQDDNLVTIAVPQDIEFSYALILATYAEDDSAIGVKKGDPAPVKIRVNGSSDETLLPDGVIFWTGNLDGIQVATDYDANRIKFEAYLG
jgi:hypothetical protein